MSSYEGCGNSRWRWRYEACSPLASLGVRQATFQGFKFTLDDNPPPKYCPLVKIYSFVEYNSFPHVQGGSFQEDRNLRSTRALFLWTGRRAIYVFKREEGDESRRKLGDIDRSLGVSMRRAGGFELHTSPRLCTRVKHESWTSTCIALPLPCSTFDCDTFPFFITEPT